MRLLVLSERYPPHRLGGYEVACAAVAEKLRERGHDVRVLTGRFGLERPAVDGHVHRLLHRPDSPSLLWLGLHEIADRVALRTLARQFRPQVVYVWGVSQLFASLWRVLRELPVPIVHNVQDTHVARQLSESALRWAAWTKPGASRLRGALKHALRHALLAWDRGALRPVVAGEPDLRHLVFCSRFARRLHAEAGLPLGDHRVIFNGVDGRVFQGAPGARREGPLRLLFAGRLHQEKGLHVALDALELLRTRGRCPTLDVFGIPAPPHAYGDDLRQRAGALDGVRFHAPLSGEPLAQAYRGHDALLFPSSRAEGLPMVLCEAMSCGLPALSTCSGGSGELVRDGETGLTFEPGDAPALAHAIAAIDDDRDLLGRLSRGAARLAREACDLEAVTSRTEDYLAQVSGA